MGLNRKAKTVRRRRGIMQKEKICALIPAAGLSSRMGDFKPLLPFRGKTVIESSVESALSGGADSVTVVTGYRSEEIEGTLAEAFGDRVRFVSVCQVRTKKI